MMAILVKKSRSSSFVWVTLYKRAELCVYDTGRCASKRGRGPYLPVRLRYHRKLRLVLIIPYRYHSYILDEDRHRKRRKLVVCVAELVYA
jgi:hypothetical protein